MYIVLAIGTVIMLVPFIWMILTAFKSATEVTHKDPFVIFPAVWRTECFSNVLRKMDFVKLYLNTIILIVGRVVCAVLTATMAGYALGRLNFKGKKLCLSLIMLQMMVPSQIFIIPQYLMISKMGTINTMFAFKDLMWPLIVNSEQSTMPLSAALAKLQGTFVANYPELMAASLLACIPMIVLYVIFQKQFIEGIATSGGKL